MQDAVFILIDTGSESNRIMMSDIGKMKNGYQMSDVYHIKNPFLNKLHKIHFSYKISTKVELPCKSIWNRYCCISELLSDNSKEYFIIVVNNAIHKIDGKLLKKYSLDKNIHTIMLFLDAYCKFPKNVRKQIEKAGFEKKYSFQKSDCEQYGFEYINTLYSRADIAKRKNDEALSDLYFVGADKGRIDDIYSIYQRVSSQGLKCDFTVVVNKKNQKKYAQKYQGMNIVSKRLGYLEILDGIANTKCILEICQRGQDGLTMRFYEALFYNKRLITNNKSALVHPMYNKDYMLVTSDDFSFDISFLNRTDTIDYHYNNEMSPIHFAERILYEVSYDRIEKQN